MFIINHQSIDTNHQVYKLQGDADNGHSPCVDLYKCGNIFFWTTRRHATSLHLLDNQRTCIDVVVLHCHLKAGHSQTGVRTAQTGLLGLLDDLRECIATLLDDLIRECINGVSLH